MAKYAEMEASVSVSLDAMLSPKKSEVVVSPAPKEDGKSEKNEEQ